MVSEVSNPHWWVFHPDYQWIPGRRVGAASDGQIAFVTVYGDTVMVPNADLPKLEKCSATSLGPPVSNLLALEETHAGALVHQLRERYKLNDIYTFIGTILVSINPHKQFPIYSSATSQLYARQFPTLPPHVFSVAAAAYSRLQREHTNQAIVISGESGSGKTEATKAVLQFLSDVAGSDGGAEALVLRSNPLLEAFGNAKTLLNDNSSRFGKWIQVEFAGPRIASCSLSCYLLEKSRVVKQANGERNYHVFYQMCAGLSPLMKQKLSLGAAKNYSYLNGVSSTSNDVHDYLELETALKLLNIGEEGTIWAILTAILHAGNLEFSVPLNQPEGSVIKDKQQLGILAKLLRVEDANLQSSICFRSVVVKHSVAFVPQSTAQALHARDALAKALYSRLFEWLVHRTNIALMNDGPSPPGVKYVGLLDIFGFELVDPSSFEQFCINYANETLQQHFTQYVFKLEQAEYLKEHIDVSPVIFVDNIGCLELLEKKPNGIFHMLDQELLVPQGSDISLVTKMHRAYTEDSKNAYYARIRQDATMFVIKHFAGNVRYDSTGFLAKNRDYVPETLESLMRSSKFKLIEELFRREEDPKIRSRRNPAPPPPPAQDEEKKRPKPTSKTLIGQFQERLHALMETLQGCEPHFIRCLKPNSQKRPDHFQTSTVFQQMSNAGLFETIRIRRLGYPIRLPMPEFNRRYLMCCQPQQQAIINEAFSTARKTKLLVAVLNQFLGGDELKVGLTKVFTRDIPKAVLDRLREAAVSRVVILVQSVVRRYNARQYVKRLKALCAKCHLAIAERDHKELLALLDKTQFQCKVFKQARRLCTYLEEESRLLLVLQAAATGEAIDRCEAAVSAVKTLHRAFPEEHGKHPAIFVHWHEQVQLKLTRLLAIQRARNQLRNALETEDPARLKAAIAEATRLNMPQDELQEAVALLSQLEIGELMIMNLEQALEENSIETSALEFLLERAQNVRSSQAQRNVITRGKVRLAEQLRQEVKLAVSQRDEAALAEIWLPKATRYGFHELVKDIQGSLESLWMSRIQEAVETGDVKKLEHEFIPLLQKRELAMPLAQAQEALREKANQAAREAIAREIEATKQRAAEEAKLLELKKLWGWKILVAMNDKNAVQLEESIIPSMKALGIDYSDAETALKTIYNELIMVAVDAKNAEQIERLYHKLKVAGYDTRLGLTGLRVVYGLLLEDAVAALQVDRIREIASKLEQYGINNEQALQGIEKVKDLRERRSTVAEADRQQAGRMQVLEEKHAASVARLARLRGQQNEIRSKTPERSTLKPPARAGHRRSLSNDTDLHSKQPVTLSHNRGKSRDAVALILANSKSSDGSRSTSPVTTVGRRGQSPSLSRELVREAKESKSQNHSRSNSRDVGSSRELDRMRSGSREMVQDRMRSGSREVVPDRMRSGSHVSDRGSTMGLFKRGTSTASILAETTIINLDTQLQMAMDRRDLPVLTELLQSCQENTHTVRVASKFKARLEEEAKLMQQIEIALNDLDLPILDTLLQRATALGVPRTPLITNALHVCYGQSKQEQINGQISLAVARVDLPKLRELLLQVDPVFETDEISSARHFLLARSRLDTRAAHDTPAPIINKEATEAYEAFLALKGRKPLSQCRLLRKPGDYSKGFYFKRKEAVLVQRLQWRVEDIPRSLIKFSKASCGSADKASRLKLLAKYSFKHIRCFMGDLYHPYPVTLGFDVLKLGKQEMLLRDEIYCQLIKQTTLNADKSSLLNGLKLIYLCLSTFAPSVVILPFLWAHLAVWAIPLEGIDAGTLLGFDTPEDLASNCFQVHYLSSKTPGWLQGDCGPLPTIPDIQALVEGKLPPSTFCAYMPETRPKNSGRTPPPPPSSHSRTPSNIPSHIVPQTDIPSLADGVGFRTSMFPPPPPPPELGRPQNFPKSSSFSSSKV